MYVFLFYFDCLHKCEFYLCERVFVYVILAIVFHNQNSTRGRAERGKKEAKLKCCKVIVQKSTQSSPGLCSKCEARLSLIEQIKHV